MTTLCNVASIGSELPSQPPRTWELLSRCLESRRLEDRRPDDRRLEQGDEVDWRQLLNRCRQGLAALFHNHLDPRVRTAAALEVEDLEQELQVRLLGLEGRFLGTSEDMVWAYLRRVAIRLVSDHRRRCSTLKRAGGFFQREQFLEVHEVAAPDPGPEAQFLAREGWTRFVDTCATCVPRQRRPLVRRLVRLIWLEGCNSHEAAQRLGVGITPQDIDNLVVRLRRKLAARGVSLPRRQGGRRRAEPPSAVAPTPSTAW